MHERQNTLEGLGSCIFKYFLKRAKGVNHAFNDKKLKKAELMGMMKWLYLFFVLVFFLFLLICNDDTSKQRQRNWVWKY